MERIKLNKSRSIKASIVDSWSLFALDWRQYLKQIIYPALATGLAGAFAFEMCLQYFCEHLLPAYRMYQTGASVSWLKLMLIPAWSDIVYILSALFVFFFFMTYYRGKLLGMVSGYATKGYFAEKQDLILCPQERIFAKKYVALSLLWFVVVGTILFLIAWIAVKWQTKLLMLIPFVWVYLGSTNHVVQLNFTLGNKTFVQSLKLGFCKSLGLAFILQALTMLPMLLLLGVFTLPAVVYALSEMAVCDSLLVGDSVTVPSLIPFLFFLFNTLGFASLLVLNSVRTWALTMKLNLFETKVVDEYTDSKLENLGQ